MHVTCVNVAVKPAFVDAFIEITTQNHKESVKEPGNLRFDILQSEKDSCKFLLYEAYESDEAAAAHKKTAHYLTWRETVADWMAQPREGIKYKIVCPTEKTLW